MQSLRMRHFSFRESSQNPNSKETIVAKAQARTINSFHLGEGCCFEKVFKTYRYSVKQENNDLQISIKKKYLSIATEEQLSENKLFYGQRIPMDKIRLSVCPEYFPEYNDMFVGSKSHSAMEKGRSSKVQLVYVLPCKYRGLLGMFPEIEGYNVTSSEL